MGMFDDLVPQQPAAAAPKTGGMFDDLVPKAAAPPAAAASPADEPTTLSGLAKQAGKGLVRGAEDFGGALGEAVMGPWGSTHSAANLMATLGLGERPAPEKPYGEQLAHATGMEADPKNRGEKFASTIGETLGNPSSYFGPGGWLSKLAMGTLSGAGSEEAGQLTEGTPLEGPARIVGGMAAGPLAARALKPQMAPRQQALADAGVQMTPGQMAGGFSKAIEDKLTSMPILGDFIQNARGRSVEGFNRAVANQTLAPIGERLERGTAAGHDTIREVNDKISDAYDRIIPNLHFVPDYDFARDLAVIDRNASTMPASTVRDFERILNNRLSPNRWVHQINLPQAAAPGSNTLGQQATHLWGLQGEEYKRVESELTHLAGQYGSSSDAAHQMLGEHLGDVVTAMRQNLERQNPAHAQELGRINTAYAMYARMRDAAANRRTSEGVFTPSDLLAGIKRQDNSVRKGAFARGDAMMQDFATAGQSVLPSKVPDSGTAQRSLLNIIAGGGAAYLNPKVLAGVVGASGAYTRPGIALLNRYTRATPASPGRIARGRANYSNAGRGAGTLRPLVSTPFGDQENPYAP